MTATSCYQWANAKIDKAVRDFNSGRLTLVELCKTFNKSVRTEQWNKLNDDGSISRVTELAIGCPVVIRVAL